MENLLSALGGGFARSVGKSEIGLGNDIGNLRRGMAREGSGEESTEVI